MCLQSPLIRDMCIHGYIPDKFLVLKILLVIFAWRTLLSYRCFNILQCMYMLKCVLKCYAKWGVYLTFVHQELSFLKTNEATGLDQISAKLLNDSASTIASSLTKIFNASLALQTFPDIWKRGKIIPLFKCNDPTAPSNYRPITSLPTLSKIMERIVHRQIYKYLQEHKLITSEQFSFRPNLSTNVTLTQVTEEILYNMENKLNTGAVFIDLRKAFDTVDHTLLIRKLKLFGSCYKLVFILPIFTHSCYIP